MRVTARQQTSRSQTSLGSIEPLESRYLLAAPVVIVASDNRILAVDQFGNQNSIASNINSVRGVEVVGSTMYAANSALTAIVGYNMEKTQVSSTPVPASVPTFVSFSALSGGRFALLDNTNDKVYFIDAQGNLLHTCDVNTPADNHNQVMDGLQVGNKLLVSEDGNLNILSIDLTTYAVSTFKHISSNVSWIGDIALDNGTYYVASDRTVFQFTEAGAVSVLGSVTSGSITGIAISNGYAYLSSNGGGEVYRMNLSTGVSQDWFTGITYPQDVELPPSTTPTTPQPLTITGTSGNDIINLEQVDNDLIVNVNSNVTHYQVDLISSLTVNGLGGDDYISMTDDISAVVNGGAGHDLITSSGTGSDTINGGTGNDELGGGSGGDVITGGLGNDTIHGNGGNDTISGGDGKDVLYGDEGDDSILGQQKADLLYGGDGNDTLGGGAGNDSVYGEAGNDLIRVQDSVYFTDLADGGDGTDQVYRNTVDTMLNCETEASVI